MARPAATQAPPKHFTAEDAAEQPELAPKRFLFGHRLFTAPTAAAWAAALACRRISSFDPWLRRAIPLLLAVFLILCIIIRSLSLYEWRQDLETGSAAALNLAAASLSAQIGAAAADGLLPNAAKSGAAPNALAETEARLYLQALAAQFIRGGGLSQAAQIALIDKDGRIAAAWPEQSADKKAEEDRLAETDAAETGDNAAAASDSGAGEIFAVGAILSGTVPEAKPLLILGNAAGTMAIHAGGAAGLASYGEAAGAPYGVFLFLDKQKMLQPWQRSVSLNITLLGSMACLMLALAYAYFAQGARARQAAAAADNMQRRIDTAMLRGRCGLWDWDMARGRIYWSHSMYEMLGYRPYDTLLSIAEVASIIDSNDLDLFELAKSAMSGEKEQFDIDVPMRHANGRAVWMRIRAQVRGKEEPHLVGISFDISEQQELAEKNAAADMRVRDAIENISEAFVLWDSDSKLVMSNGKYQEYSNGENHLPAPQNTGGGGSAVPQPFARPLNKNSAYARDKGGNYSAEVELADSRWLKLNGRQTKDGGFVLVGTDISELKQQHKKLLESDEKFRTIIRDLQRARSGQKKRESDILKLNKSLKEANIAKSEFLANMSHELRTPLNAIIGFSQMMVQNAFGPVGNSHYQEYVGDIYNAGRHLLTLINEILDMSKIEAGRFTIDCTKFDFVPILEEALRAVSVQREEKQINLETEIEAPLWVEADSRALRQICLNLLSNAVKFTPAGGQIRVRAKAVKGRLIVSIADSGIGIPKAAIGKLGKPFEQVENQFTKTHEGSGLGLAISRSLTQMHKGELRVFSREDKGTIVSFAIPLRHHKG